VAQRDSQSIRRIRGLWRFAHAQQRAHHLLHLFFSGIAVTRNGGFDFAWLIAADRYATLGRGKQNNAANFSQSQSGFNIKRSENRFDRNTVRLKFFNECGKHGMNFTKAFREMFRSFARGAQRAKTQHAAAAAVTFDYAIPRGARCGGIDA
jgi:hypothetical protein